MSDTPIKRGRGRPKTPQQPHYIKPVFIVKWEYQTLASERPLTANDYNQFGADGWELVCVYVRMDAVHAVFKREMA